MVEFLGCLPVLVPGTLCQATWLARFTETAAHH